MARRYLPIATGALVALVALANLLDLLWPGFAGHFRLFGLLVPRHAAPWAHALAAPVALLMLLLGWALTQRRRAALATAVAVLGVMAVTLVGERRPWDAAACAVLAVGLYLARSAWQVMPPPGAVRRALIRVPFAALGSLVVGVLAVLVARGDAVPEISGADVLNEAAALLTWRAGPADFPATFHWLPEALALVGIVAVVVVLAPMFARPRLVHEPRTATARRRVDDLVCRDDSGNLASFLLRDDHQWMFSDDRDAVLAYRVEAGVLLVAGDPVGHPDALPGLLAKAVRTADAHGLLPGAIGAHPSTCDMWRAAGVRGTYMGDEAVVEAAAFSLQGRAIRKVRQSVTRLEREGYTARLVRLRDLSPAERADLEAFRRECRAGQPERGFSMAHARIDDHGSRPSWVLLGHDPQGALAGLLFFVPGHGGRSQSLGMQLRRPGTPNGLMEFLVVHAVQGFAAMGVDEVSLNFVSGGRYLRDPQHAGERVMGSLMRTFDRWFQVKRLEKFTEKFFPRWDARYVVHPGWGWGMTRVTWASMLAEGQIPRLGELIRRAPAGSLSDSSQPADGVRTP